MKLQTLILLRKADHQIDYNSKLLLLGSCFSEHIGEKLEYFKFQSEQNPFGILFHSNAIEQLVIRAINNQSYTEEDIFFLNERWHCFDAHSSLSDVSKEKILQKLNGKLEQTNKQIKRSTHIIITLGTAWVYRYTKTKGVVANCHKVPQKEFSKALLSVDKIVRSLENVMDNIQSVNRGIRVIFTVSPVRHLKDGFVENQRSKAHLITAVHQITNQSNALYFPSYELMMDELRDYRFYESDMVHPNKLAIDYIWEKFKQVWIDENAFVIMDSVAEVQRALRHRPFNPNAERYRAFMKSVRDKISYLKEEYPFMQFSPPLTNRSKT